MPSTCRLHAVTFCLFKEMMTFIGVDRIEHEAAVALIGGATHPISHACGMEWSARKPAACGLLPAPGEKIRQTN